MIQVVLIKVFLTYSI